MSDMGEDLGMGELRIRLLSALIVIMMSMTAIQAATITVGPEGDYATIQAAVDGASPGDTIRVESGTFRENIVINKSVVLRGRDAGDGRPVVDGKGVGSAIVLSADEITVEGLVVMNSGFGKSGIEVGSDDNTIRNNLVTANKWYGISLADSDDNVISGNVVSGNKYGIWISAGSLGSRVTKNELKDNTDGNAVDAGTNDWDDNAYDDLEEETSYSIAGGSNVDENPRAVEAESEDEDSGSSTITVTITIPTPIIES